jgi:hypothetical protein
VGTSTKGTKMKPVWIDYKKWEDYNNGMYENRLDENIALKCVDLFKSKDLYEMMTKVTQEWEISSKVNLNKTVFNRQAWIGQSTCSLILGATIEETTWAWMRLTQKERDRANDIADTVIEEYHNETLFTYQRS